jgi:hypothetical protein
MPVRREHFRKITMKQLPFNTLEARRGEFTPCSQVGTSSSTTLRAGGDLPVLIGNYCGSGAGLTTQAGAHAGWGSLELREGGTVLTFRLQAGPDLLYWLANPSDPHVWTAIRAWAVAGRIVLMARMDDGLGCVLTRDFAPHEDYWAQDQSAHADPQQGRAFALATSALVTQGHLAAMATSDLTAWPGLRSVRACVVATPHTPHIATVGLARREPAARPQRHSKRRTH